FFQLLREQPPPLASVERIRTTPMAPTGDSGFQIAESTHHGERRALISPDVATCQDCLRELCDPHDRRHNYPFLNCVNCGPRFTIVTDVPYDRASTTMRGFPMCADCAREYHDPADRRFHAQPVCCPACGPRLTLLDRNGVELPGDDPIRQAARLLADGAVIAVKGLGGYHLAADARCEPGVAALRGRKHRQQKPFAIMAADLEQAAELVMLTDEDRRLLAGPDRPIVLLARRDGEPLPDGSAPVAPAVAASVAPGTRELGVMLPYTAMHHLLLRAVAGPIVLTSGNVSDEPIAYQDEDAHTRLADIADAFLTHNRPIHVRADDSVVRSFRAAPLPLRRSRGQAPRPLGLPLRLQRPVLGCGAELKSTFCLAKGQHAFLSHHIGDLENHQTLRSYADGIRHYSKLFDITPEVIAHDLHPEYLSTKHALEAPDVELIGVQHHHAHIASCLVDNGEVGPVLGVAFDGLGHGVDGTLWGGEFLVADLAGFHRVGHLEPVPLPGGATAIRQPWRMAVSHLNAAYDHALPINLDLFERHSEQWPQVRRLVRRQIHAPLTSSAGRLFDAVAAILGVR
ncbi:MAG: carbamoyltransferase HypF, partial [Micromonosporaceae bacterium]